MKVHADVSTRASSCVGMVGKRHGYDDTDLAVPFILESNISESKSLQAGT